MNKARRVPLLSFFLLSYLMQRPSTRKTSTSAVVGCLCGKTSLTFRNPTPRSRAECACVDCRQKLQWAAARGGRSWNPSIINLVRAKMPAIPPAYVFLA